MKHPAWGWRKARWHLRAQPAWEGVALNAKLVRRLWHVLRTAYPAVPAYVRCDNGPEFTAGALIDWCGAADVDTEFIDPGSPWPNGFIESFNAQFRREQLAGEIMDTMAEAQYLAEEWKAIYNHERPHGSARKPISYRISIGLLTGTQPRRPRHRLPNSNYHA